MGYGEQEEAYCMSDIERREALAEAEGEVGIPLRRYF